MKNRLTATGLIVEYNPLHNGHLYHIQKAKEINPNAVIIAVMSPNFVQRGEPAFINKWDRTRAALNHGIDIVVELPTVYAIQSADYFAKAAVEILALMGVNDIVFGSESAELSHIENDGEFLNNPRVSYAANGSNPKASNDILANQYIKNSKRFGIKCHAIKRTNSYHDSSVDNKISSASAIRLNYGKNDVSHTTPLDLNSTITHYLNEYESLILARLYESPDVLSKYLMVNEGIENLLIKHRNLSLLDLIEACTSKKYTRSRIQRTLIAILLGIDKDDPKPIRDVRVLGMNTKGKQYLADLRDQEKSPVKSFKLYSYKDIEIKATALFALVKGDAYYKLQCKNELKNIIIID